MKTVSFYIYGLFSFAALTLLGDAALAQDVSNVTNNIVDSVNKMPGLVSALCYLFGLILGVSGVLKLKAHVESPGEGGGQTPLRTPLIRLCVGGFMFALPILYEAIANTIGDGSLGTSVLANTVFVTGLFGIDKQEVGVNFNTILANIVLSFRDFPDLIAAFGYLLGLVLGAMGAIKLKEHVENPDQTTLKEPVIRFLAAGALFSLSTIFGAMFETIDGGNASLLTGVTSLFGFSSIYDSSYAQSVCVAGGDSAGSFICGIIANTGLFPAFLSLVAYIFGLILGVWGILKIRDHVLNPQQTQLMEGISRFIAGGAFFALPAMVSVFQNTISNFNIMGFAAASGSPITSYNNGSVTPGSCPGTVGLDGMLACFVNDIYGPMHSVLTLFSIFAGIIFIMIGISRLMKSAQEGAKGPGGIGTIMTFAIGGALLSYNELIRATTTSITGSATTKTYAVLDPTVTAGMSGSEVAAAHAVITAIIKFMIIVGLISFVRGLFIVRSVAEGGQQASMMAGVTHILGGAFAINLGPLLNAIQVTLNIAPGLTFS